MKLRFLLGRAGTGKTWTCLSAIRRRLVDEPEGPPLILLVPEQATFQMERALLSDAAVRATHRAHVLSFQRLAARVLQETGGAARPRLGAMGKRMMLRALIHDQRSRLRLLSRAAGRPGFIARLANTMAELRAYRCSPEELARRGRMLESEEPVLAAKLHDLALIVQAFEEHTADRFTDPDGLLDLAAGELPASRLARGAWVWVDGFSGFTPQELAVLRSLWRSAETMEIALCLDPASPGEAGTDVFAPTRKTYARLLAMAREDGLTIEPPRVLGGPARRFAGRPALSHLEREAFVQPGKVFAGSAREQEAALRIVAAADARAEVEAAAREILRLCRERGWRFRDISVIVRRLDAYQDLIKAVFTSYGIPHFIDSRKRVAHHPLVELVRSSIEACSGGWRTEAVIRCLKTDLMPVSRDEADRLENYALEHGIEGAAWVDPAPWRFQPLAGLGRDEDDDGKPYLDAGGSGTSLQGRERQEDEIQAIRERVVAPLRRLGARVSRGGPARALAAALWEFFEDVGAAASIEEWIEAASQSGRPEEAQEHAGVWHGVVQLLDELVDAMGDHWLSAAEFRQVVEAGLEDLTIGLVPPGLDQVLVGSVERSRQPDIKAALVLGALDGTLPQAPAEDVIFTDRERERLSQTRLELSPTSRARLEHEQYLVYISLTRASDYLWLSYPAADGQGRSLAPSYIVRRVTELFPQAPVVSEPAEPETDQGFLDRMVDRRRLVAHLAARLRRHRAGEQAGEVWWQIYQWVATEPDLKEAGRPVFAGLEHGNLVPPLPPPVAEALFGRELWTSVTRLETLAACPFRHFAAYGLKLRERPRRVLDRLAVGIFVHGALRRFVELLWESGRDWGELDDETAVRLADRSADELIPNIAHQILLSSARHAFLGEILRRTVRRAVWALTEHARRGRFRPVAVEVAFGKHGAPVGPWVITARGGPVRVVGQIDRIDAARGDDGRVWIRVVDYKSSARDLNMAEVAYGLSLQLPVYMAVALEHGTAWTGGQEAVPAGMLYFPAREPMVRDDSEAGEADIDALLRREMRMRGMVVDEPDALRLMDATIDRGSDLVAAGLTKDGRVTRTTNALPVDGFATLARFAARRAAELAETIRAGDVSVRPYRLSRRRPCSHCPYHSVCQFDPLLPGNGYRDLPPLSREAAWQVIEEDAE
ncbi:MAG: helicase-exonuclease AddAB subunit AddB [Firmicutes bacterium]|nr:helicase-exonuclease AddAB subunit AddB [Bacillota bacterium]